MRKLFYIVRKQLSKVRRVRAIIGSNLAFAMLATSFLPSPTSSFAQPQASLIIPQESLNQSFDIKTVPAVQVPVEFVYMSQGFSMFHPGVDLAGHIGSPVKPVMAGVVSDIKRLKFDYGNMILIDHGNGLTTLYAHLSKINVKIGDEVTLDSVIGQMGSTGHSTGPHLHLEIREDGKAINPLTIILPLARAKTTLRQS